MGPLPLCPGSCLELGLWTGWYIFIFTVYTVLIYFFHMKCFGCFIERNTVSYIILFLFSRLTLYQTHEFLVVKPSSPARRVLTCLLQNLLNSRVQVYCTSQCTWGPVASVGPWTQLENDDVEWMSPWPLMIQWPPATPGRFNINNPGRPVAAHPTPIIQPGAHHEMHTSFRCSQSCWALTSGPFLRP